jgi:hypothetical protein
MIIITREGMYRDELGASLPNIPEGDTYRQGAQKRTKRVTVSYLRTRKNSAVHGMRFSLVEVVHGRVPCIHRLDQRDNEVKGMATL